MAQFDLILRGGRILDPGTGRDEIADIAFAAGKVAAIGAEAAAGTAAVERRVEGCIVTPGQIDLHAHVYWGGTSLGVDADRLARRSGTTTWLDVGSWASGSTSSRGRSPGSSLISTSPSPVSSASRTR